MSASPHRNPYAAPNAASIMPDLAGDGVVRCGRRVLAWSTTIGSVLALIFGATTYFTTAVRLHRFGGERVPRIIGLLAVRGWGPGIAAVVPALTTVVLLHRAGKRNADARVVDARLPSAVALAVALLFPTAILMGCLGAVAIWCLAPARTVGEFVVAATSKLGVPDVAYGTLACLVYAVILGVGVRQLGPSFLSRRWPLVVKLLVVWLALQIVGFAVHGAGRWFA